MVFEEVKLAQREFKFELDKRTNALYEIIPDEVWKIIFEFLLPNTTMKELFLLHQVSKRWQNLLPTSITKITLSNAKALERLAPLSNLRSLTITKDISNYCTRELFLQIFPRLDNLNLTLNMPNFATKVPHQLWDQMTNLKSLHVSNFFLAGNRFNLDDIINQNILKRLTNWSFEFS